MRRFDSSRVPRPNVEFEFRRAAFFGEIDLEIGAGVGRFAIDRAIKNPERAVIAVEKTHERYTKFAGRVRHHAPMSNLFPIHAEAASFVTHFIPEESIDEIFILYPNPYPKLKQRNLRWHNRAFMAFLLARLKPEGLITLATNMEDYRNETSHMMTQAWHLTALEDRRLALTEKPRTHFEQKYLQRGEDCWNLVFRKSSTDSRMIY